MSVLFMFDQQLTQMVKIKKVINKDWQSVRYLFLR